MIGQQKERRVIKHLKTMSTPAAGAGFLSEWKARSIYRTTHEAACFACGTRIMHVVQLVNEASGMLCNLGTDCYDEVRRRVHGFPTIVRDRSAESDSAVKVVNAHYARFSEAGGQRFQTWRGWLLAALRERRVPDALVKGVQELKAAGTIADLELLWGCINFHDKTRTESALFLLGRVMACRIYPNDPNRIITIRKAQDLLGLKPLSVEKLRGHGPNGRSDFGATPPCWLSAAWATRFSEAFPTRVQLPPPRDARLSCPTLMQSVHV